MNLKVVEYLRMSLKDFIIVLYILGLGGTYAKENVVNLFGSQIQTTGCDNSEKDLNIIHENKLLEKIKENSTEGTSEEARALWALSTKLSGSETINLTESELSLERSRKLPNLDIMSKRPATLFAPESKPFNILSQLQLDEIRDAQEQLVLNPGRLKAVKKKKKNKNKKKPIGEEATIFYTQLTTKRPHYYHTIVTTTKVPKKIKYIVHKKNTLKKKKKEYLNHLKHVFYPFIKFIAFFTVLNPFTLKVFIFALISPVVFGFLGFMALSFMIKPALHMLFDVKKRVDIIKHKKWREKKQRERWRHRSRPITIHKHYYKNVVVPHPHKPKPPLHILSHPPSPSWPEWVRSDQINFKPKPQLKSSPKEISRHEHRELFRPTKMRFNPILPHVEDEIEDWPHGLITFGGRPPPKIEHESSKFKHPKLRHRNHFVPSRYEKTHDGPISQSVSAERAPFL